MTTTQFIHMGLDRSAQMALSLIDDMKDEPMVFPTPRGGNHPLWVMGHLAWSEGVLQQFMTGKPNPLDKWTKTFGFNSEPTANLADYPSLEEARRAFVDRRADTLIFLETLRDADLDNPTNCPPQASKSVGTLGKCFLAIIMNTLSHHGQVADARRAAGRAKLYM
jgi:DinB superfamily